MSIREQIEEYARSTFAEIERIEDEFKNAELRRQETPQRMGAVDAAYAAKAARAEADYLAAREAYRGMQRNLPGKAQEKMAAIRRDYAQDVARQFAADPEKLNAAELELLKSGIMRPDEYRAMMEKEAHAGNATMVRLIASYAAKEAETVAAKNGAGDERARELRAVSYMAKADPAGEALRTFDAVSDVLMRCVNNPSMIPHWDGLAGPMLDLL